MLTVTAPAPTTGAVRPQTRVSYTSLFAYYKVFNNSSIVPAQFPIIVPTNVSACQTTASCAGGADEVKTTIGYGPQIAGTANNLLPVTVSSGSGNGALTATVGVTYDSIGNRTHVDGPLPGTADTSRTLYDAARQTIGAIGPDPDGAGALKNRAQRMTWNVDSMLTKTEQGTTVGQSDANWAAFVPLQQVDSVVGTDRRKTKDTLSAGGTSFSVQQYSYDPLGRPECSALRMNTATWGALPASACTLATTGAFGPDRIGKTLYDAASQITKAQSALGTADQADDATLTYTPNGKPATVADANGNLTTYEYDEFDRGLKTRFPSPTVPGTSSTTDYEQVTYDAASNVTQHRQRDSQTVGFAYDNLNRRTLMDLSGSGIDQDISYGYDLLGRLTTSQNVWGHVTNYFYDALSRTITESTTFGGWKLSQYDLAGRRTRLTWADGFYVTYDHLVTGETTHVRESGALSGIGVLGTYTYDDLGRRNLLTRGNGTTTTYGFDAVSRLISLAHNVNGSVSDLTLSFSYSPASQIATSTRSNDIYAWGGHFNKDVAETPDGLNRLVQQGANGLTYDGRGNVASAPGGTYSYSQRNQLVSWAGSTLYYDPPGRLDLIHNGSVGTAFDFDGSNLVTESVYSSGAILNRYVHGPGTDDVLIWYEGATTIYRRWMYADERGSTVAIGNDTGDMMHILSYDDYGTPAATNVGRFQYTGQAWLPDPSASASGLYYYKARMYAPNLGRFMQTDPIGYDDGMNLYAYVGGDPVNFTDPSGLCRDNPLVCKPIDPNEIVVTGSRFVCLSCGNISGNPGAIFAAAVGAGSGTGRPGSAEAGADTNGQCPVTRKPTKFDQVGGFFLGVGDGLSFGAYSEGVAMIPGNGIDGQKGTTGYSLGNALVGGIGGARLIYAGTAKLFSQMGGRAAVSARNTLKGTMSGMGSSHPRIKTYDQLLSKYGSDKAVAAAAARTNPKVNTAGALAAGSAASNAAGCP